MDFIKKYKKYIVIAGCVIMAIACFLTFVKAGTGVNSTIKFTDLAKEFNKGNDGKCITAYVVLVAAIVSAVLVYFKKEKFSLISTGVALIVTFYDFFKVKDSLKEVAKYIKISYVAPWVVLIGAIIAILPIALTFKNNEN